MSEKAKDLTGRQFGRLVVVEFAGLVKHKTASLKTWRCRCECGTNKTIYTSHLLSGATRSCGCLARELATEKNYVHGMASRGRRRSTEYTIWANMKARCLNPSNTSFEHYGGRGIVVCQEWQDSFEAFLTDMGHRPSLEHELDRENNDGPYSPENCRWAVSEIQRNNRRNSVSLEVDGVRLSAAQWARRTGIGATTIRARVKLGWSAARAVSTPVR